MLGETNLFFDDIDDTASEADIDDNAADADIIGEFLSAASTPSTSKLL